MLNNKPFNMAVDLHQQTNGDDKNGIGCRILCLQRYSPIQVLSKMSSDKKRTSWIVSDDFLMMNFS